MDLRVFKYPMYTHAVLMFFIIIMAMFASEIILPIYMQGPLALTAATAGLVLLPGSILNGLMSPFMGHLFDKFGPRVLMIPATFVLCGTMFMMSNMNDLYFIVGSNRWIYPYYVICFGNYDAR